jgi:hypothetical protein
VFNGSEEAFYDYFQFFGGTVPPTGETMKATNKAPLNLRETPGGKILKLMPANTMIEGPRLVTAADGGKWLETSVPQAGYCAAWLLTFTETPPVVGNVTIEQSIEQFVNGEKWLPAQGNPIPFVKAQ